jgi:NADH:ubiquinone oxidoreductase subunit 3 (subunit A)
MALLFFIMASLYSYFFSRSGRSLLFRELYECGFKSVPDNRIAVDIQYSVLCLIFLIYDMEIVLLLPLSINITNLPMLSAVAFFGVLLILCVSY